MKLLAILLLLAACSKSPKFQAGDCIAFDLDYEPWQEAYPHIYKVQMVGKKKYLLSWEKPSFMSRRSGDEEEMIEDTDRDYIKVQCPTGMVP